MPWSSPGPRNRPNFYYVRHLSRMEPRSPGLAILLLYGGLEPTQLSGHPLTRSCWTRGAVVATLILLAAVGFCMFEGDYDGDHHAGSVHVCLAMVGNSLARTAVIELLVAGSAVVLSLHRLTVLTLGVPVPPPKFIVSL